MKPITLAAALAPLSLALLTGCGSATYIKGTAAEAPQNVAGAEEDIDFVAPDPMMAPPGSMEMDWQPTEPPPVKQEKPRKLIAKPHHEEKGRGRLFALPTTYEH